ncbi:unnamed protein product [Symbiodinium sp. CCMP2456]|nr:unnamed protein product [Symbiodinium sp. CCMP2456]
MPSMLLWSFHLLHTRASLPQPLHETEDGIFAPVQVARLPFHKNWAHLKKPPERFWIEVGMNNWDLSVHYQDFGEGDFVLGFEPLLDKYGERLASYRPTHSAGSGKFRALGRQHERGLAFPFAVGCKGMAKFRVAEEDSCSSLLPLVADTYPDIEAEHPALPNFKADCATSTEIRTVPCISLKHVIGDWLGGQEVWFLKVDAEGADLAVVQSAGNMLRKIRHIQLEVHTECGGIAPQFLNAPNCSSTVRFMRNAGYRCTTQDQGELLPDCGEGICQKCYKNFPILNLFFIRQRRIS